MFTPHHTQRAARLAGGACIVGASVIIVGAFMTQIAQASTDVSDELWRYPWSSGTAAVFSLVSGLAQVLLVVGVLGLARSGAAGRSRGAKVGLAAAAVGTALVAIGEFTSIPIRNETIHDGWPQLVGGVFAAGTVLTAIGFLLVGGATLRAGAWHGWRRFTPLATGVWALALVGLQFTGALPTAVGIYGLCFVAIGVALSTTAPAAAGVPRAQVQRA
jgi:hypothetical protein